MNSFPSSLVVDKRRFYTHRSITHLFLVFSQYSGRRPGSEQKYSSSVKTPKIPTRFQSSSLQMLLIGLCLGVTLGIAFVPFFDSDFECSNYSIISSTRLLHQKLTNVPMPIEDGDGKDFHLINAIPASPSEQLSSLKAVNKINQNKKYALSPASKIQRPRYFSTELGLRKKLLIAIIVSSTRIDNLIGLNQTLPLRVDKVLYFVGGNESTELIRRLKGQGLTGVVEVPSTGSKDISEIDHYKVAWTIVKYFADKFVGGYDFLFISLDKYYVHGRLLMDLLNTISVSYDTLWGVPRGDFCSLEHGVVISRRVIQKISLKLDRCFVVANANPNDFTRCIGLLLSRNFRCERTAQELTYTTSSPLASPESLFSAVTVGPIDSLQTFYKIDRRINIHRHAHLQKTIESLQSEIESQLVHVPPKFQKPSWPVGLPVASVPKSRFDVISWTYFTRVTMFAKDETSVQDTIQGIDRKDTSHSIQRSLDHIYNQTGRTSFDFTEGYRRYDPVRGMEYILHFSSRNQSVPNIRIEGVRPLSSMELVSMPFVTENRRITILVPITAPHFLRKAQTFLDRFFDFSTDRKLNTALVLTIILSKDEISRRPRDIEEIKNLISHYNRKASNLTDSVKAGYLVIPNAYGNTSTGYLNSVDAVVKRIVGPSALILTIDSSVNIKDEFLNRVRMNTVLNWQVYSPIPFVEYNPSIYMSPWKEESSHNNVEIEVTKNTGYFDSNVYCFFSFFAMDYVAARKSSLRNTTIETDLRMLKDFSVLERLFIRSTQLHVLRAPEPHLQVPFTFPSGCLDFEDCVQTKWGSKAQLAQVIFNSMKNNIKSKSL